MKEFSFQQTSNGGWIVVEGPLGGSRLPQTQYAYSSTEDLMAALPKLLEPKQRSDTEPKPGGITYPAIYPFGQ